MLVTGQGSEATAPQIALPSVGGDPSACHAPDAAPSARIRSVDALRGFIMFMMIFVNDLAGAGKTVPDWMVHFSDRHRQGSGMTFVDLVFPAFLLMACLMVSG